MNKETHSLLQNIEKSFSTFKWKKKVGEKTPTWHIVNGPQREKKQNKQQVETMKRKNLCLSVFTNIKMNQILSRKNYDGL